MELIQKFEKWKEFNDDEYQVHVKISSVESDYVDKGVICMEDLEKRKEIFGICAECDEPGTGNGWCQSCNAKRFEENFENWTSGNKDIDKLIQHSQLSAVNCTKCLEWIPYEKFQNITFIAKGGFSRIYSATWQEGHICYWDIKKRDWKRIPEQVALKILTNTKFLNEVKFLLEIYDSNIVQCYGITQHPNTKNYAIVFKYYRDGNMRDYLNKPGNYISCELKIDHLLHISRGLLNIHNAEKIHRDLHSGNILFDGTPYISDFGLCQPVDYEERLNLYGAIAYVAPEVLRKKKYTKAADIYSFGILMNELLSEDPPYNNISYKQYEEQHYLMLDVIRGTRPNFSENTPELLKDLIAECWHAELKKRPTAKELYQRLNVWNKQKYEPSEIYSQIKECEKVKKISKFPTYSQKIHNSKNISKSISQLVASSSLQFDLDSEDLDHCLVPDLDMATGDNKPENNTVRLQYQDQNNSRQIEKARLVEWFEESIKNKEILYYEFQDFNNIIIIGSGKFSLVFSASWKDTQFKFAIKKFTTMNEVTNEVINGINLMKKVCFHPNIIKFCGITKSDEVTKEMNYLLIFEYAEGGTLHNYLKKNFSSLNWQDKYRLALQLSSAIECLHENKIIHNDLNSNSILIQQNSIKLADFGLSKRIKVVDQIALTFNTIPYNDPKGGVSSSEGNEQTLKLEKSDVYSVGVLLWELSGGKKPFASKEYNAILAEEIANGLRETMVEDTPKEYYNLYSRCWDSDPDRRPTIQDVVTTLKAMISSLDSKQVKNLSFKQQIIQQFKLNHGLFLDGYSIKPSEHAVFSEDGDLNMSLYEGQPLVYIFINDHNSHVNLLSFKYDDNDELNKYLRPSDMCINFPVAEITYSADLLVNVTEHESYGHLFARKILVGGKLFIDDFESSTSTQIDSFKFLLTWMYDSAKYSKENPFNNLSDLNFLPKIRTLAGEDLNTCEKLTNWMNNLYQNDVVDLISYNDLIPISKLGSITLSSIDEKQPGVANFKEKLNFHEWVGDSMYVNLTRWINEKYLICGLVINKNFELEHSNKVAINFLNIPNVDSSDKFYFKIMNPTTNLEDFLISNNIFSSNSVKNIRSFPFAKIPIEIRNCKDYAHFLVKLEKYRISFNNIIPSEGFKQAIENALENMKPFTHLQIVFAEYGYFFPLSIVIGKSLKNILPNSFMSNTSEEIDLKSTPLESLNSQLDCLNISYLLTTKGSVIEKSDLSNWIQSTDDSLEIIEFDDVIPSYDILGVEQKSKVDVILNRQNDLKIIMTGIEELKDLDVNNTEHYKRINIKPSLEDENYEVFGSVISKNNLRLEDILITFELYDLNGFSATIKTLNNTNIDIKECYILWMIIGNPSKLSVFSPRNRELQVYCIKEPITLQRNNFCYPIKTPCQLAEGYTIFVNVYCSTANYDPINIKINIIRWSEYYICFQIVKSNYINSNSDNSNDSNIISEILDQPEGDIDSLTNIEISICILSSYHENLSIDNRKQGEYSLDLIGHNLNMNIKVIPFAKFFPLIKEIGTIFDEIIGIVKAAEHNKRTCKILQDRVQIVESFVRKFRGEKELNKDFFINKNYSYLQDLTEIIKRIKKFISEISQMKTLIKYIRAKSFEKTFKVLCEEFDSYINLLPFSDVDIDDELGQLKADQDDLSKYLHEMVSGIATDVKDIGITVDAKDIRDDTKEIKDLSNQFSATVVKVNAMNITMKKLMMAKFYQKKIDNIFQVNLLNISDYKQDDNEKPRKNGRVTKWVDIRIECIEFAFKIISKKKDRKIVQNQVAILKELHNCQNIIKFYGLTCEEDQWYLVTEWAEYGNLREFYTEYANQFDLKLKLRMSLDIARGLNFLRAVEIIHHDIRAENILITLNETAKLANFKLSHYLTADTLNLNQNVDRFRYCAPELLVGAPNYKYDYRCEVYSFGILLWEIAEERIPYQYTDDFVEIVDKVDNKVYREPFSENSLMPEEFKKLEIEAVRHDPDFRPKITRMFEILRKCVMKYSYPQDSSSFNSSSLSRKPSTPKFIPKRAFSIDQDAFPINLPDFASFRYMTLADAAKQHKMYDKHGKLIGNVKIAYKCFETYANLGNTGGTANHNQIKAKYYKTYYISKGLVESPPNKDKIVAELFKEVADDEANEFPEAKVKYGDCLYRGKGVEQNFSEALKYFEKAAEDGYMVAMYNTGNMYYNGVGCTKDIEKAKNYIELAVYNGYEPAIRFRNDILSKINFSH